MVPMVLVTAFRVSDLRACSSPSIVTPRDAADQKGRFEAQLALSMPGMAATRSLTSR
jgi:hypothetical protein